MKTINKRNALITVLSSAFVISTGVAVASLNVVDASAEKDGSNVYITGASLALSDDITVKYLVENLPDGYTQAKMTYSYNGQTYEDTKTIGDATSLVFDFNKVTPQNMTRAVDATITFTGGGEDIIETKSGFTVAQYCNTVLSTAPAKLGYDTQEEYDAMKSFVADLLNFGAMAQQYRNASVDDLASSVLNVAQKNAMTEFVAPTESDYSQTGTASTMLGWRSATLRYDNNVDVAFRLNVKTADMTGKTLAVSVQKDDETPETITAFEQTASDTEGETVYTFIYENLSVTEFDKLLTVKALVDGEQEGKTLTYSVKTYVYNTLANSQNETEKNLAKATYVYGQSATAYKLAQSTVIDDVTVAETQYNDISKYASEVVAVTPNVERAKDFTSASNGSVSGVYAPALTTDGECFYALLTNQIQGQKATSGNTNYYRNGFIAKIDTTTLNVVATSATVTAQGGYARDGWDMNRRLNFYYRDGYVYLYCIQVSDDVGTGVWKRIATNFTGTAAALETVSDHVAFGDLDMANCMSVAYNSSTCTYAVLYSDGKVYTFDAQGTLIKSFGIKTTATGKKNDDTSVATALSVMYGNNDYLYLSYCSDNVFTPVVNIYTWDGAFINTVLSPMTTDVYGRDSLNVNVQGVVELNGALYSAGIEWDTPSFAIYKTTAGTKTVKASVAQAITADYNVTYQDTKLKNWGALAFTYGGTSDGNYFYVLQGAKNTNIVKINPQTGDTVGTTAAFETASVSNESIAAFVKDGFVYVQSGTTGNWVRVACAALSTTGVGVETVALTFGDIAANTIMDVQYDKTENAFAVLTSDNKIHIIDAATNTEEVVFSAGAFSGAVPKFNGDSVSSISAGARLTGSDGYVYVHYFTQGTSAIALRIFDYSGNIVAQKAFNFANSEYAGVNAKLEVVAEVNGELMFTALKWEGGNHSCIGKITYAIDNTPNVSLGEYIETVKELGNTEAYTVNAMGKLPLGTAFVHGSATDGTYDYYADYAYGTPTSMIVYRVIAGTNVVIGSTKIEYAGMSNSTFYGHIFCKDGELFITVQGSLYKIATADIGVEGKTFTQETGLVANVSDVKAGAYSAERGLYAFISNNGKLSIVQENGTVVATNNGTIDKVTGVACDENYIYSLSECAAGAGEAVIRIFDWSGNLVASNVRIGGLKPADNTKNNVQSMYMRDGKFYFATCAWEDAAYLYEVELDLSAFN